MKHWLTGAVIPTNFKVPANDGSKEPALHITSDNIDILDVRRNPDGRFPMRCPNYRWSLGYCEARSKITMEGPRRAEWVRTPRRPGDIENLALFVQESWLQDVVFGMSRVHKTIMPRWTEFNKKSSSSTYNILAIGCMPLNLNPTHEMTALSTVLRRYIAIALQAIWQILAPQISSFFEENCVNSEFMHISGDPLQLKCFLHSKQNWRLLLGFVKEMSKESPNFQF